jgi:ribosome-associated protein
MHAETKAQLCCRLINEIKGLDLVCLDLRDVTGIADFFIICSGEVEVHRRAIADEIIRALRQRGEKVWHLEGYGAERWILIDLVDVVVHIFSPELRRTYELEKLWGDARPAQLAAAKTSLAPASAKTRN